MKGALRDGDSYKSKLLKHGEVKTLKGDVGEVASADVGNTECGREAEDHCLVRLLWPVVGEIKLLKVVSGSGPEA